jgi:TorA maturation chaperone TorD
MNMEEEKTPRTDWETVLMSEKIVLGLFGKILFEYPEREWFETLAKEGVFEEIPFAEGQEDVQEGMKLLAAWGVRNKAGLSEEEFDAVRGDYTTLFIGPGKVMAPPWESIYFRKERIIFQEETLEVRNWYRRFGLESVKLYHEPDDHIGLELAFIAHLAGLAYEAEDEEKFNQLIEAQKEFLSAHTLKWAAGWVAQVLEHAKTDFFKGVALVVRGVLTELNQIYIEG